MLCQSRFVGFLVVPLQLATEHDSILINVLALHCMHKNHLICFYKNPPCQWFSSYCTFAYHWMFWILALVSYLGISSPFVLSCTRSSRTSLDALDAAKRQTSSRDSCRAMDWPNYFPIDFLASQVAQDPHEQYRMSGLEPYASDSRGRLFCTEQSCNICLPHRHWDWIALSHYVCLCLPFPP